MKLIRTLIFSTLLMSIIPAFNLYSAKGGLSLQNLYSLDSILKTVSPKLVEYGVSVNPDSAVVGKDEWYFLGDKYANSVTEKRRQLSTSDTKLIDRMKEANQKWSEYYYGNGVDSYVILVGPDKEYVYPEYLPSWFEINRKGNYFYNGSKNIFDPLDMLLTHKSDNLLYFKDDTHWNSRSGWYVYKKMMEDYFPKDVALDLDDIEHPSDEMLVKNRGDLGSFLYVNNELETYSHVTNLKYPSEVEFFMYDTGKSIYKGENKNVGYSKKLIRIKNASALNNKKVLWLRDSFGGALSSFIHETYTDILHVHYNTMHQKRLKEVVQSYKPDIVIVTAVERTILKSGFFRQFP